MAVSVYALGISTGPSSPSSFPVLLLSFPSEVSSTPEPMTRLGCHDPELTLLTAGEELLELDFESSGEEAGERECECELLLPAGLGRSSVLETADGIDGFVGRRKLGIPPL